MVVYPAGKVSASGMVKMWRSGGTFSRVTGGGLPLLLGAGGGDEV